MDERLGKLEQGDKIPQTVADAMQRALLGNVRVKDSLASAVKSAAAIAAKESIRPDVARMFIGHVLMGRTSAEALADDIRTQIGATYRDLELDPEAGPGVMTAIPNLNSELDAFLAQYDGTQRVTQFFQDQVLEVAASGSVPEKRDLEAFATNGDVLNRVLEAVNGQVGKIVEEVYGTDRTVTAIRAALEESLNGTVVDIEEFRQQIVLMIKNGIEKGEFVAKFVMYVRTHREHLDPFVNVLSGIKQSPAKGGKRDKKTEGEPVELDRATLEAKALELWREADHLRRSEKHERQVMAGAVPVVSSLRKGNDRNGHGKKHHEPFRKNW